MKIFFVKVSEDMVEAAMRNFRDDKVEPIRFDDPTGDYPASVIRVLVDNDEVEAFRNYVEEVLRGEVYGRI